MEPEYLFVYGTLRAGAGTPQAARLARDPRVGGGFALTATRH